MRSWKRISVLLMALAIATAAYAATITDNTLKLGNGLSSNKTITFDAGSGSANSKFIWNSSSSKLQYAHDGTTFKTFNLGSDIDSASATSGYVLTADGSGGSTFSAVSSSPTGAMMIYFGTSAPTDWLLANGGTIGSASSGGTSRANADTQTLFYLLWASTSNTDFPIQDSSGTPTTRGGSAASDFSANKRMPLPDMRNVFARGANGSTRTIGGISYPAVTLGATAGDLFQAHTHQMSIDFGGVIVNGGLVAGNGNRLVSSNSTPNGTISYTEAVTTSGGSPRYGSETRPVNIGVNYIIKL